MKTTHAVRGQVKLTVLAKALLGAAIVAGTLVGVLKLSPNTFDRLFPSAKTRPSSIPPRADLAPMPERTASLPVTTARALPGQRPGCTDVPEVRLQLWAWNAQMGLLLANGGVQSTEGSAMCRNSVNLRLVRQDDPSKMREDLAAFATALKAGDPNPKTGTAFVAVMGDGSAAFLKEANDVLGRLGPGYRAKVIGSAGYSWGEDKFMGPPAWRDNPQASRGGLVAGVLRDGDWNIAQKWLAENRLCTNPDEHTYDPSCLNWFATSGYVEAAQAYVGGVCEDRPVVREGRRTSEHAHVCVDGVVTWTPGDVMVAHKRGGLVSIVSTKEYRGQMPNTLIGIDSFMASHRSMVEGLLAAMFEGAEQVSVSAQALHRGAEISATVYGEEDATYWEKYFHGVVETDRQGLQVELGGSRVNNLSDNLELFGVKELAPTSTDTFAVTYRVFADIVKAQYPEVLPSYPPAAEVVDTSYLVGVARHRGIGPQAAGLTFNPPTGARKLVSHGSWHIAFEPGKAAFGADATRELEALFDQLVIASGTSVEVHGHTDSTGGRDANQTLSEARAFAVKAWLEHRSAAAFPSGRVRVFAHGQENPIAPNASAEGRAQNRRVEIVLRSLSET